MSSKPEFKIMNDIEHTLIRTKDTGVFERVLSKNALSEDYVLYKSKENHSPCLLKCIDEPIVNCSDACLKGLKVTEIKVNIDNDGTITIYNNGKGIPHKIHKEGSKFVGYKIHTPEMIFTQFRSGSNLNTNKDHDSGGINGVGIKLTNVHSDWLHLETVSKSKIYKQEYEMNLGKKKFIIKEPTIEDYEEESYTQIQFFPHYKRFEYTSPPSPSDMKELIDIVRYRVYHLAVFLSFKKVKVYFNNKLIEVKNTRDLIDILEPDTTTESYPVIKTKGEKDKFIEYSLKVRTGKFNTTSSVNGIVVLDGTHITHLTRAINSKLKDISKDKDKKIDCKNYLCVVAIAWLPVTNWGNQSKDKLELKETDLKDYNFKDSVITKIAKDILEKTKILDVRKAIKQKVDKKLVYDKYTAPKKIGKGDNTLFIAEGDSAMLLLKQGLVMGNSQYSIDNTGIFSLGGVPTNIAKGITEEIDDEGEVIATASEKFYESKVFGALVQCLKIDPDKTYKTKDEIKTLNYKKIVICVDADLDGIGNIASLVLQMFYRLWPNLFKHKYIHIWNSPILRVTNNSGKVVKEFKYEQEFKSWDGMKKDYKVSYVKGLAGHPTSCIKNMFSNFDNDLVNMKSCKDTKQQFEVFFGKDSSTRKEVLSTPVEDFTDEEIKDMNTISHSMMCDRHLNKNTKEFQLYAMRRTIPGLDNFTPVRRKSFTSFYKHNQTSPLKVYMAAGRIAYEYLYHHGDASIQGAIIKMTQDYPGSNVIPLLLKDGQTGSRDRKGKDSGSARYVGAALNKKVVEALFPKDDIPILDKNFSDGTEVEPKLYLPTLPLPILEFQKSVSYAWCLEVYPRDIKSVCNVLKKLCKSGPESITKKDKDLPFNTDGFKGEIKVDKDNKIHIKGCYKSTKENNKDVLHITELPFTIT